ncbi:hypothetical protein MANES_10G147201v8 [Manihot esculenta]|uniref:Uncharacterized protein n=1 Tax=Manihot esculenta TaxID=3983 RepID=A0ACB7H1S1_MANES|nr:hypothetical protein MANES_10G147201v8 [Manihot esculenta]
MVTIWIFSSLSKELIDAFIYAPSSQILWEEIKERFGQSNGPLLYQIKQEINSLTQANTSIMIYFTKIKRLWDELTYLKTLPYGNVDKLIQFLMGLNDSYDHIRNHILLLDPLPTINKAYSMVGRVEKQREIHSDTMEDFNLVMMMRNQPQENITCDYCKGNGHTRKTCFKLHGYSEWFTELKPKKMKGKGGDCCKLGGDKYMQNQNTVTNETSYTNFSGFVGKDSRGYPTSRHGKSYVWIINSGASSHTCSDLYLFHTISTIPNKNIITLPDGTSNLSKFSKLTAKFSSETYFIRDLMTEEVLAKGK